MVKICLTNYRKKKKKRRNKKMKWGKKNINYCTLVFWKIKQALDSKNITVKKQQYIKRKKSSNRTKKYVH